MKDMTTNNKLLYNLEEIDSSKIITPVSLYQRPTDIKRVREIAKNFDERIANEPKVSFRDGKYFVFDGQHTLLARVKRNGGNHLPVLCKVYFDLSAEDEAALFATQTGISSKLKSGERLRAKAFSNDRLSLDFIEANERLGINVSLSNSRGEYRLRCVATAFKEFQRVGTENYCEAMKIICEAWDGIPSSFYVPVIVGICRFVNLYEDYYNHDKLVRDLMGVEPKVFIKEAESDEELIGVNCYVNWLYKRYNSTTNGKKLPRKF